MSQPNGTYRVPESLNDDFSQRVVVDTAQLPWLDSPQPGVQRRLLDRVGGEVARATSLVRYAPDSAFPPHSHGAGEEFLVLEGTFHDEHGAYPAGTYVRNPPGTRHAPFTREGCVILVKLRQMRPEGEPAVVCDTSKMNWRDGAYAGLCEKVLFEAEDGRERVTLERLAAGAPTPPIAPGGEERLVLSGSLLDGPTKFATGTWVRTPGGSATAMSGAEACVCWVKRGHLPGD